MPDANGNPVLGDLITSVKADDADEATKVAVAIAADVAATAATAAKVQSHKALAAGLAKVGSGIEIDPNGVATVWLPDTSADGYHSFRPAPLTTPIPPDAPAPTPPPTPAS